MPQGKGTYGNQVGRPPKKAGGIMSDKANKLRRVSLQRKYHENWLQKIKNQKLGYERYPETWRDFLKVENLKVRQGSQEAGKHRTLPNTTSFYRTAGEMEAIQGKVIQKAKAKGTFSTSTLAGLTKKGAASFARSQVHAQMGGLEDDQIIQEVAKARMRDRAALPKVQTKGKKSLLTKQPVKRKGGSKPGGVWKGGGGKRIQNLRSPWELLKRVLD